MKTSSNGINLIKTYEGFSPIPYFCPAGIKTIGYGHVIKPDEQYTNITRVEANRLLKKDILICEASLMRNINIVLNQNQFDALISFIFNLGSSAFQRSTLRQKINYGMWDEIPHEWMRWVYSKGVALNGLVKRRNHELQLFLSLN